MQILWQCEVHPYRRRVLQQHWPTVDIYTDICNMRQVPYVDVICGGFPCQDLSYAGRGAGIKGERSRLWFEMLRVIGEVRPEYVIVENVPALRKRGLDICIGGLAQIGYDAEWTTIRASDVGAPHRRERLWIVAYPNKSGSQRYRGSLKSPREFSTTKGSTASGGKDRFYESSMGRGSNGFSPWLDGDWENGIPRTAEGVSNRVQRLSALGDALVPQIVEWIGSKLVEHETLDG